MSASALIRRARDAGVELRLVGGKVKVMGKREAVAKLIEPLRRHRAELVRWFESLPANDPEPPTDPADWRELAAAYNAHHVNCPTCQAAGRGTRYGLRCGVGMALWSTYQNIKSSTS